MAWKCKECGGKIVLQEDNIYEDTFTIKKDTTKRSRKAKKSEGPFETYGWRYICENCGNKTDEYYDDIESIGEWKK